MNDIHKLPRWELYPWADKLLAEGFSVRRGNVPRIADEVIAILYEAEGHSFHIEGTSSEPESWEHFGKPMATNLCGAIFEHYFPRQFMQMMEAKLAGAENARTRAYRALHPWEG